MPTYEYECLNCGAHFDLFQKMSESPIDTCVRCKGSVRRIVSGGSGLIFKGSGFYITDYAKKKTSATSSTATTTKTDTKASDNAGKTKDSSP